MISSAIPSAKYSFSGSALALTKGSTATDFAAATVGCGRVAMSVEVVSELEASACANIAAVLYLAAGSGDNALLTARSTLSGMLPRNERSGLAVSVNRFAITACAVGPVKARSPLSISYSITGKTVLVASTVEIRLTRRLLGADIRRSAHHHPGLRERIVPGHAHGFGDSEIHDHRLAFM